MILLLSLLILVDVICLSAFTYDRRRDPLRASICTVFLLLLVVVLGTQLDMSLNEMAVGVWHNPWYVILAIVGYSLTGLGWAGLKWRWFIVEAMEEFEPKRKRAIQDFEANGGPDFKNFLRTNYTMPPQYRDHTGMLATWVAWWWASMLATFAYEWVWRFFAKLVEKCKRYFAWISDWTLKDSWIHEVKQKQKLKPVNPDE